MKKQDKIMEKLYWNIKVLMASFLVVVICFIGTNIVKIIQLKEEVLEEKKTVRGYGIQGLPVGRNLQATPDKIDDHYLYYSDRIIKKFIYNQKANVFTTQVINDFMNSVGKQVSKYVMLVPSRVTYEKDGLKYSDNCLDSIGEIYNKLSKDIKKMDVNNIYKKRLREYLYLRTDEDITSLGGYYLAEEFCRLKRIQVEDINKYKEYKVERFAGAFTFLEQADIEETAFDYISYYLKDGASNWQRITVRRGDGEYESFESPTIALSRRGQNIFIGGNFSHSIIQGDGKNHKTILLVGGSGAKKLAVWLTPYYETVYLVNLKWYQGRMEGFSNIFHDYTVTDLIFVGDVDNLGETRYYNKLIEITKK